MALSAGTILGSYEILDLIGLGGMGEVYRARDTRLGRIVAVKVLLSQEAAVPEARQRFEREARAVSSLNHPHICALYDVGQQNGIDFLVMELLEGETLSSRLKRGPLDVHTATAYAIQIADCLDSAQREGIVHRDLKPGNIMLTATGVKVLDFGLAKLLKREAVDQTRTLEDLTQRGTVVGTLAYISPETLRGEPAQASTDIWALGVILHEMTSGTRPFGGATSYALTSAILREPAPELPSSVPPGLRRLVHKCLAKEPVERYQSAAEVRAALDAISLGGVTVESRPVRRRRTWLAAAVAVALAILGVLAGLRWAGSRAPAEKIQAVAVLPFENLSKEPDQEFFAEGMHQQLITDLSKIREVRVISRTSVIRYRGTHTPLPQIARELGVDAVVLGSVIRAGNKVRIAAQLVNARKDQHLWAESYDRDLSEVLALQRDVARTIAAEIRVSLSPEEQAHLSGGRKVDPEVHELVLRGQYWLNKEGEDALNRAAEYFTSAIARDPHHAEAYAARALSYVRLSSDFRPPREVMPKAKSDAKRSLELDDSLAETHTTLASVLLFYDWDWPEAEKHLKRAVELSPNLAVAHIVFASYWAALGKHQEALSEIRLAQKLDPLSLPVQTNLLFCLLGARQFDEAIAQAHRVLQREPDFAFGYAVAALAHGEKGEFDQAVEAIEKATKILSNNVTLKALSAHVHAAKGDRQEAAKLLADLKDISKRRFVCAYEVAHVYVKLGDKERAFEWLAKGKHDRADCMVWLASEPWMDPLRGDPRYNDLIAQIGLTGKAGSRP